VLAVLLLFLLDYLVVHSSSDQAQQPPPEGAADPPDGVNGQRPHPWAHVAAESRQERERLAAGLGARQAGRLRLRVR